MVSLYEWRSGPAVEHPSAMGTSVIGYPTFPVVAVDQQTVSLATAWAM
jgi:hypothetical protein